MLFLSSKAYTQGTFRNLDFESATVPVSQPPSQAGVPTVDIAVALPGWSASIGTNQQSLVMYNTPTLDTSSVGVFRSNSPFPEVLHVIEGEFSAWVMGGYTYVPPGTYIPTDTSIWQTGLVPANARSIMFKTSSDYRFAFVVSLGGQALSSVTLQVTPNYVLRAADVTPFAGRVEELKFTIYASRDGGGGIGRTLDSIEFSPLVVPEPNAIGLFAFGTLILGMCGFRNRRKQAHS